MVYRIEFIKRAAKELKALPLDIQLQLKPKIDALAENPRPPGVIKLEGEDNAYRLRVRDYRLVYEIYDDRLVISVVRVGHRREVYRRL
ncbi:MAG: type II toxin-antitoxin system RelE/ParE family toxin [Stenomitos rutilans HA7619-LM2]|nr:type II toxin-antitoxin system RelE/ParE family toxin [Stenomitos rutilans HA7619-LM2]MBW4469369.1 type II toxin-antitoxin system RelE/ParE family toxin [Stenomitos rutilans HA7619-LM2]